MHTPFAHGAGKAFQQITKAIVKSASIIYVRLIAIVETHSEPALQKTTPKSPFLVKYFYWLIVILIACAALAYAGLVWRLNREYIRADFAAAQAQRLVAGVYQPLKDNAPEQSILIDEQEPTSGSYSFSLSDSAERTAFVRSKQTYTNTALPYSEMLLAYAETFGTWGWKSVPVNAEAEPLDILFEHPQDDRLLAGMCRAPDSEPEASTTQYTVFVDFDEGGSNEVCKDRACTLIQRYCRFAILEEPP
jgi:hypothetical protein